MTKGAGPWIENLYSMVLTLAFGLLHHLTRLGYFLAHALMACVSRCLRFETSFINVACPPGRRYVCSQQTPWYLMKVCPLDYKEADHSTS